MVIFNSEHSPIRDKWFSIQIRGVKSWVATHLCRHSIGFTPYISTQRDDRIDNNTPRDDIGQGGSRRYGYYTYCSMENYYFWRGVEK